MHCICCELSNWEETRKCVESIGPIDLLVNNAGVCILNSVTEATQQEYDTWVCILNYIRKSPGYIEIFNFRANIQNCIPLQSLLHNLRPPGGSECQFSHFVLTSIGRLNYFLLNHHDPMGLEYDGLLRVSELQWQCLRIKGRFQKMYGFSIVISIDSLIIKKNANVSKHHAGPPWYPIYIPKDVKSVPWIEVDKNWRFILVRTFDQHSKTLRVPPRVHGAHLHQAYILFHYTNSITNLWDISSDPLMLALGGGWTSFASLKQCNITPQKVTARNLGPISKNCSVPLLKDIIWTYT